MSDRFTALQIGMTASLRKGGGVDRYFFSLIRALTTLGVTTRGLVSGDAAALDPLDAASIECFAPDRASLVRRWFALRRAVDRRLPGSDVVVSHFAPYAFPVLDRIHAHPVVVHFHGSWAQEGAAEGAGRVAVAAKKLLERIVYRGGGRFIVLSRAFATVLRQQFGVPEALIRVVPGGVDLQRFRIEETRAEARLRLGWPPDRPTLLTVRRLVHAKGIENLITSAALLRERIPDLQLMVCGTGPLGPSLQRLVRERGLEDTVRLNGFLADEQLPTAYRAADLMVVPTVALEGFGLIVLEALACGTPALVTPISGLPETVSGLDPALICRSPAPADLVDSIRAALDGTLRLPDEQACRAHAERFAWSHIAERVSSIYREVA